MALPNPTVQSYIKKQNLQNFYELSDCKLRYDRMTGKLSKAMKGIGDTKVSKNLQPDVKHLYDSLNTFSHALYRIGKIQYLPERKESKKIVQGMPKGHEIESDLEDIAFYINTKNYQLAQEKIKKEIDSIKIDIDTLEKISSKLESMELHQKLVDPLADLEIIKPNGYLLHARLIAKREEINIRTRRLAELKTSVRKKLSERKLHNFLKKNRARLGDDVANMGIARIDAASDQITKLYGEIELTLERIDLCESNDKEVKELEVLALKMLEFADQTMKTLEDFLDSKDVYFGSLANPFSPIWSTNTYIETPSAMYDELFKQRRAVLLKFDRVRVANFPAYYGQQNDEKGDDLESCF